MDIGLSDPSQAGYARAYCRWFATTAAGAALALTPDVSEVAGTGEVHLTNMLCPVNYDTGDMTRPALQAACTTPGAGFQFTLQATRGGPRTTTTDTQGGANWTGLPAGKVTIAETMPDGYLYAQPYCSSAPVGSGPGSPDSSLVQSDGETINGTIQAGQALYCTLFTIAEPESTVAVIPFLCPSDYDTGDMTRPALTMACSTPGMDIDFTLTSDGSEQRTGSTGSNGFVEWKGLPSGAVSIEESVPPGLLLGAMYCDVAPHRES